MSRFASGKFVPANPEKYIGHKTPTYRSSWEWAFMKFCDNHPAVQGWASEAVRIPYKDPLTGKISSYVPDFFIKYVDKNGKQFAEVIEVKPMNQTLLEKVGKNRVNQAQFIRNQAKWTAASAWCKQQGIKFRVVSEKDLFHQGTRK